MKIKQLKEKIRKDEQCLQKLIMEVEKIWENTGLDPKDTSYFVEKAMRFELAQKIIQVVFSAFQEVIEDYKKLCLELEKPEE